MIIHSQHNYGRTAHNRIGQTMLPGVEGARALVESFYYAFNQRDMEVFTAVWAEHQLIQLNNPLGGMLRGYEPIAGLYRGIFNGSARVWVELDDIVEFQSDAMLVFAGRETGEFTRDGLTIPLSIRTSRIVQWMGAEVGWKQVHHHGSIDDVHLLAGYQQAVGVK